MLNPTVTWGEPPKEPPTHKPEKNKISEPWASAVLSGSISISKLDWSHKWMHTNTNCRRTYIHMHIHVHLYVHRHTHLDIYPCVWR